MFYKLVENLSLSDEVCGSEKSLCVGEADRTRVTWLWRVSRSSWAAARPGCWAARRPERWSLRPGVCSAPRRCAPPAAGDGNDAALLVVPRGVSSQLQDLSGEILEHSRQIDGSTGTDAPCVVTFAEKPVNTTDGELQSCPGRASLSLRSSFAAGFASATHC